MGRILRKKPASLKKKKRQNEEALSSEPASEAAPAGPGGAASNGTDGARAAGAVKKPQALAAPAPAAPPADNVWTRSIQFLREVKTELKKVTWPTRKQTLGSTGVVIVLVMIISMFLGLVDMGLAGIVRFIFN
ncbi:MAG: preprotein translocase subunit SecE [Desulfobacterales bacterium]